MTIVLRHYINVLVNNAGITTGSLITDPNNAADMRAVLDTNVLGFVWCAREAFRSQQTRNVTDGHVVVINSVVGHKIPVLPDFNFKMYYILGSVDFDFRCTLGTENKKIMVSH